MISQPRVLVAAPTNIVKNYCLQQWCDFTNNLTYPNYERLLVDNSPSINYSFHVRQKMGNCRWHNPKGKSNVRYMAECQEVIRKYAIKNKFDYIFSLEVDITPAVNNIIELLMIHNKLVVSAMYHILKSTETYLCLQELDTNDENAVARRLDNGSDMLFVDGTCKKVFSAGLGCTLIKREVFEKIPFKYVEGINAHADSFFSNDLFEAGISNWVDTSIQSCIHNNQDWSKHTHL